MSICAPLIANFKQLALENPPFGIPSRPVGNPNYKMATMRIVAISGSLRAGSSNSALIKAAIAVASSEIEWVVYEQLGDLPHFSPDLDVDPPPPPVARLRALLASAQAILISTPEYAHGMPGSLKNALDWLVSSGELSGKPVALFVASTGGEWARSSLTQTLEVIEARVIAEAGLSIPNARKRIDPQGNLIDASLRHSLTEKIGALISSVQGAQRS
jgi:NAD(P)H-dependent FMN reductase